MDRLFVDANVLFSAAYREDAGVRRLWKVASARLVTSSYAVEEARRNLAGAPKQDRLRFLLESVEVIHAGTLDPSVRQGIELPEKDWPILAGAVVARATRLVTGDLRDFGRYFGSTLLGVRILTPAQYLQSVRE